MKFKHQNDARFTSHIPETHANKRRHTESKKKNWNCNQEKISPQHPRRKGLKPPSSSLPKLQVQGPSVQNPCRQPIVPGVPPRPSCWLFRRKNFCWTHINQRTTGDSINFNENVMGCQWDTLPITWHLSSLSKNGACPHFLPGPFYRG